MTLLEPNIKQGIQGSWDIDCVEQQMRGGAEKERQFDRNFQLDREWNQK